MRSNNIFFSSLLVSQLSYLRLALCVWCGAAGVPFSPKFVMTDQALSEALAIRTVFPQSRHVICLFHFMSNIRDNLHRRVAREHGKLKNKIMAQFMTLAFGGFASETVFFNVRSACACV